MAAQLYAGTKSLNLVLDTPYDTLRTTDIRDDLTSVKVWYSTTSGFDPALGQGTLAFDGSGLSITIAGLLPATTYYVKYAFISIIDPDTYTISAELSQTVFDEVQAVAGRTVSLEGIRGAFVYDSNGSNPTPTTTEVTATAYNTVGTPYYEFLLEGVTVQNSDINTYPYTAKANYADMPDKVSVKLREGSTTSTVLAEDFIEFVPVKAGASAINVYISNPAHSLYTTAAGVSTYTGSGTTITVFEGSNALTVDSSAPYGNGTFRVTAVGSNISPSTPSGEATTTLVFSDHSAMTQAQARITYTITVKNSLGLETVYTSYQNFSKSIEGTEGLQGTNLNPTVIYDFNGATLPTGASATGSTVASSDNGTTSTITTSGGDQNVTLSSLTLIPSNSYLITMRIKLVSGTWEGIVFFSSTGTNSHGYSASYYKSIPAPTVGVWTDITLDMRDLTVGGTNYIGSTSITGLRFDFVSTVGGVVVIDHISIGKYGVATPIFAELLTPTDTVSALSTGLGYTLPTGNALSLYSGSTKITSGVAYGISSTATLNGLTLAINASTGVITLSGASWTSTREQFTLTATYNSIVYSIIYSISKTVAGSNGVNGVNGTNAITGSLTNEAATVPADSAGTVTAANLAAAGGTFNVYDGVTDKTGAAVTYSVVGTPSGITITIATTGVYTVSAMSAEVGTATLRAVYGGVTIDKVYSISKSKAGTNGSPGDAGAKTFIAKAYQWSTSATTPTLPTSSHTYTWGTSAFSGTFNNGWEFFVGAGTNGQKLYEISKTITETNGTATTTTFTFASASSNTISIRQDGSIGYTGPRVTDIYYFYNTASSTTPTAPTTAEVFYNFSTGAATVAAGSIWSSQFSPANPTSADGAVNKFWAVRVVFRETVDSAGVVTQVTPVVSAPFTWQNFDGLVTFTNLADGKNVDGVASTTLINGSGITAGTISANKISTTTLSAIQANLGFATVASTGGYLKTAGRLYGGDSEPTAGTPTAGFFLGYDGTTYKFDIGNAAKTKYLSYDGSTLSITGGNINVSTTGSIYGGQTAYNTGTGFFIGYSGSNYVLSIGTPGNTGVTADVATNTFTKTAHGLSNGTRIYITFPRTTYLKQNTVYYVINSTTNTFQISTTLGGAVQAFGGTNSTAVEFESFSLKYTGADLIIKGANVDLGALGSLVSNKTTYNDTNPGVFLGAETALYKFSISNGYSLAANSGSSIIYSTYPPANGTAVQFYTPSAAEFAERNGGTMPTYNYNSAGISTDKQYYVINSGGVSGSATTFQISETYGGTAFAFTGGYNVAYESAGIRFDGKSLNLSIPDNQYGYGLVANRISTVRTTTKGDSVIITGYSASTDKSSIIITKPWFSGFTDSISLGRSDTGVSFKAWSALAPTRPVLSISASSLGNEYYHTNRTLQVENYWGNNAAHTAESDTTDAGYFYGHKFARALRTEGVYQGTNGSVWLSNAAVGTTLLSQNSGNGLAMYALANSTDVAFTSNHAFRGKNNTKNSSGLVGAANGYAFYAENTAITSDVTAPSPNSYGPFTGSHDALIDKNTTAVVGDIVCDVLIVSKNGLSDTIAKVAASSTSKQKTAIGILTGSNISNILDFIPNALKTLSTQELIELDNIYKYVIVNAIGEGQINVCGENGNLEPGDLIVTSSMPGKGMKQDDDIIRNITVAKCREAVTFSSPSEVKLVSCIYLCG